MELGHRPAARIEGFSGEVITASHPAYDESRRPWNAMFDRRPFAVARCTSTADVAAALGFARRQGLSVAVRCAGHRQLPEESAQNIAWARVLTAC